MKLQLTSVKYAEFASTDSNCFEAIVWIDGVKSIRASNEGSGGGNHMHDIVPGSSRRLDDYAKTLPKEKRSLNDGNPAHDFEIQPCAETLIGDLLEEHLSRRDMKRALGKKVYFIKHPGEKAMFNYKTKWDVHTSDVVKSNCLKKYPSAVILNELSEDEALKIWRNAA